MYNHGEIDKKWQDRWLESGVFKAEDFSDKPKKYLLVEFPFPSGAGLHVGHPRSYVALDVMARKYRAEGNNVLYPMGWDAFGLPTENYAIKTGRPPAEVTAENVAIFKRQTKSLGLSFDWSREVNTTDPGYYKWTQWQFLQFFKAGLAYKAKTMINWCPSCKIGLANEEAQGGVCERCGGPVEKREKEQWMIGITKYADRLLSDLNTVDYLPRIRKQQEEWIGRSEGAEVDFAIEGSDKKIRVFTTRPDTLFGVTYVTLAPEHELVAELMIAEDRVIGEPLEDSMSRQAVRAMCVRDGKMLVIYGKDIKEYLLPGGGIEEGESPEEAIVREFIEETGYKNVKIVKNLGTYKHNYYHTRLDKKICGTETIFIVDIENDEQVPRTEEEMKKTDAVWMTIAEAKEKISGVPAIFGKSVTQIEHLERYLEVEKYISAVVRKTEMERTDATREKTGVFTGAFAINPVNGKRVPVWISDYVLAGYGTGAVMAVPAHDERDFEFATKFGLEIKQVVLPPKPESIEAECWTEDGVNVNSEFLNGLTTEEAKPKMIGWLEENKVGARKVTYKLRDWVFSRQRYWGEPIPLVHCEHCAAKKQKVLYVHGFASSLNKNKLMRERLEALGFEVLMPTMTTKDEPDFETWMEELKPYFDQLGEDDIVIGHSLGGNAVVNALTRAQKKIKALLLMAPAIGDYPKSYWESRMKEKPESAGVIKKLLEFIAQPLDLITVSNLATSKEIVWSSDDNRVPEPTHAIYPAGWYINRLNGLGHLRGDAGAMLFVDTVAKYKSTGWSSLPDSVLPLTLPEIAKYEPTDNGESPLASIPEWVNTTCPRCGGAAKRETDTMPNWAGSSWYFLRYIDAHNDKEFAAADKLKYWMPVDLYNGGMEHVTLHLLYSRFWNKFMYDCGWVPTAEPYARRVSHGLIMAEDGMKMSKSKGNVVNPDEIVQAQGADTLRMYELFIGPFSEPAPWSVNGVSGVRRFLDRVMRLPEMIATTESEEVTRGLHKTIKKITEDVDRMSFNTAVAQHMMFVNVVYAAGSITKESLKMYLAVLNVFAPHVCEELWAQLGGSGFVCQQSWPQFNHSMTIDETFELVVQINGKVRDRIVAASDATEDELKSLALSSPKTQEWLEGKEPQKVIVIKGKLVNIVV